MSSSAPTVVDPVTSWEGVHFIELWRFRHLAKLLLRRDIVKRYRQTLLGPLWLVLPPIVRMGLLSAVFGWFAGFSSEGLPYPLFAYATILPWELFATGGKRGIESLVKHVSLMQQAYFPRLILPLSEVATSLADFAISFVILVGLGWFYGYPPSLRLLAVPLLLLVPVLLALVVGSLGAAWLAHYRDARFAVSYLLQAWFYMTPVAYSADALLSRLPGWAAPWYRLNPMRSVVEGFRWAITGEGAAPGWELAIAVAGLSVLLYLAAMFFERTEHKIVDVL